jgi:hypothetical protein
MAYISLRRNAERMNVKAGGIYGVITNDVSDYIHVLVRIAHIICNHMYKEHALYINERWQLSEKNDRAVEFDRVTRGLVSLQ